LVAHPASRSQYRAVAAKDDHEVGSVGERMSWASLRNPCDAITARLELPCDSNRLVGIDG
jgi:hypothetical protein